MERVRGVLVLVAVFVLCPLLMRLLTWGELRRVWAEAAVTEKPVSHATVLPESASVFAWILNGSRDFRSVQQTHLAARRLIEVGVHPDRIYVASDGDCPDAAIFPWNFDQADPAAILVQQSRLQDAMERPSTLIIFATGHGAPGDGPAPENTWLALHRGWGMTANDLRVMIREMPHLQRLILVTDACYSGGFVKTLQGLPLRYVGMSPTDESHPTVPDAFTRAFWAEIAAVDRDSSLVSSFDDAILGCPDFRAHGYCDHTEDGCQSFARRATLRLGAP
jgi:hypothetical protein